MSGDGIWLCDKVELCKSKGESGKSDEKSTATNAQCKHLEA